MNDMVRASVLDTLLFWLMMLLGAAALVPCLVLPAWVERQAQAECLQADQEYLAGLEHRLATARKQIEHLQNDSAYVLRLAEQDFGASLKVPNEETIRIEPGPAAEDADGYNGDATRRHATPTDRFDDELFPQLGVFIDQVMQRYPHAQVFLDGRTRPLIMLMGGVLLLAGILLLGTPEPRRPAQPPSRT
jgi:hypothetical protein